jgi:superfamily I DNA and/or RNA helicase
VKVHLRAQVHPRQRVLQFPHPIIRHSRRQKLQVVSPLLLPRNILRDRQQRPRVKGHLLHHRLV